MSEKVTCGDVVCGDCDRRAPWGEWEGCWALFRFAVMLVGFVLCMYAFSVVDRNWESGGAFRVSPGCRSYQNDSSVTSLGKCGPFLLQGEFGCEFLMSREGCGREMANVYSFQIFGGFMVVLGGLGCLVGASLMPGWFLPLFLLWPSGWLRLGYESWVRDARESELCVPRVGQLDPWGAAIKSYPVGCLGWRPTLSDCLISFGTPAEEDLAARVVGGCTGVEFDYAGHRMFVKVEASTEIVSKVAAVKRDFEYWSNVTLWFALAGLFVHSPRTWYLMRRCCCERKRSRVQAEGVTGAGVIPGGPSVEVEGRSDVGV